jgi:RimJ/RimL family protein N-acetyltransferase
MPILLETDRLVLRRFTEDDVDHLYDLNGDPDVMCFSAAVSRLRGKRSVTG